ncbi:hypothetical protein [Polyangium mundeleinium]|uniref:Tetratricopeptide repeat protein n=1 Tax=Polyangium mundeleinium TaxID=2995306 RepID=A0ABT5F3E6_9BACT|nr:hypothetical protein [Polyangium mundeleinium]MDC0748624.1 hypothetical protein [Polyangium mundeleinium]
MFAGATAALAIEKEPELAPLPAAGAKALNPATAALYGYVRVAAGWPMEALPFLERGASRCIGLDGALGHQQVVAALGAAREASGDRSGACEAYRRVLSRWGKAKPSVTVKEVAKRAKALSCDARGM